MSYYNTETVQPQDPSAFLIGTGEFSFAEGFATPAAAVGQPFMDFGNALAVSIQAKTTTKKIIGSYRGIKQARKTVPIEIEFSYQLKLAEFRTELVRYLACADDAGTPWTQMPQTAATADAITPAFNRWQELRVSGNRVRRLTSVVVNLPPVGGIFILDVPLPTLTEGSDYVVDYETGRIRFYSVPGAINSILITARGIYPGDAESFQLSAPFLTPVRRGMGRVLIFDRAGAATDLVYDHSDFYCEVWSESTPNIDGQNQTELTMMVNVLTPGNIWTRPGIIPAIEELLFDDDSVVEFS